MEISLISSSYRLTLPQPGKAILKDALSEWLLRELDHPSTTVVNASEDSCGQEKDMTSDSGDRNGETGTGSDTTVVENTPKSTPVETSKPVESKCRPCCLADLTAYLLRFGSSPK